ncbi:hypothetical protein CYMTET_23757, partial [Cymbomonas tetramitiformis]
GNQVVCLCTPGEEPSVMEAVSSVLPELPIYAPGRAQSSQGRSWSWALNRAASMESTWLAVSLPLATSAQAAGGVTLIGVTSDAQLGGATVAALIGEWRYGPAHIVIARPPAATNLCPATVATSWRNEKQSPYQN